VTSFNVYAGLAGFSPNTDTLEPGFNLPAGDFSKAFVLQDKSFNTDHSLCYTHDSPEFFGDLPVINGTIAPRQSVEPRRYTFTFINGSDSRFYHLSLTPTGETEGPAPQMTVVGSDSGYLLHPSRVSSQLIAPGERYKIVVDFTERTGSWVLSNDAATPFPDGDDSVATIPSLMRFDVGTTVTGQDTSSIPQTITETNNVEPPAALLAQARLRTVQAGELSPGVPQLGDAAGLQSFTDPATETPQLGSTEAWAMQNHSPDAHPIHEHLVELRLVGRWPVVWDPNTLATGHPVAQSIGAFQPPGAFESGPKDTYVAPTDFITVWIGQYTIGGLSVWHCHILSHEDSSIEEMMRPLEVGATAQTQLPVVQTSERLDQLVRQGAGTAAVTRLSDFNSDGNTDLIARDTTGRLWLYPGDGAGGFLPRFLIGGGWNSMTALVTPGDVTGDGNADVLARDTAGRLWLYPGDGRLSLSARRQIGAGWNGYTITDAANMNGAGRPDLFARDTAGVLWLYPLSGNAVFGARTRIGAGWNGFTFRGPGDVSGDGRADILATDPVGSMRLYRGNGAGNVGGRSFVGGGWKAMTALATPGNLDTVAGNDLLSRDAAGRLWFYPGNDASSFFSRHQIGGGWNSMTFIG
jgi:FtsP/CotA-like multicopper oxidase with cupredoxin domain